MRFLIKLYLINLFGIWFLTILIPSITITGGIQSYLILAGIFTGITLVIKPILKIILLPINALTLGLSGLLVNALILYGVDYYYEQILVSPWTFQGITFQSYTINKTTFGILTTYILAALVLQGIVQFLRWLK